MLWILTRAVSKLVQIKKKHIERKIVIFYTSVLQFKHVFLVLKNFDREIRKLFFNLFSYLEECLSETVLIRTHITGLITACNEKVLSCQPRVTVTFHFAYNC